MGWVPHILKGCDFCRLRSGIHAIIFYHKISSPELRQRSVNFSSPKG